MSAPTISITLMVLLWLLAHFQPNAPRSYAAACFSLAPALHAILFWEAEGFSYYFSAALFNLAVIILLNTVHPICRTVVWLQRIALAMVVTNGTGAGLWYYYYEPMLYNWAFVVLYAVSCAVLARRGPRDVGGFTADRWRDCFRFRRLVRVDFLRKIKPEINP